MRYNNYAWRKMDRQVRMLDNANKNVNFKEAAEA